MTTLAHWTTNTALTARTDRMHDIFERQRVSRWRTKTSSAAERIGKLGRLRDALMAHAAEVNEALHADLGRPPEQPASLEVGVVLADIEHTIANLEQWMAPVPVASAPLLPTPDVPGTRRFIQHEAKGVVLIFGAWNQPFMLLLQPLVAALAAGNTAIVKPNELTPASSALIATIVREAFAEDEVAVFEGGVDLADQMLELPVDHIFFTGSPAVGRKVASAAARHLASVTLELGGKSPAIIDGTADLKATAAIIGAAKLYNAGQVCISFDHVWVAAQVRDAFVSELQAWIAGAFYQDGELKLGALTHIVNPRNFERVGGYVADAVAKGATLVGSGRADPDTLTIEPALLIDVPFDAAVMQEEIFGPIIPIIAFASLDEVTAHLRATEKPLAIYAFTTDPAVAEKLLRETSSGGVTINAWAAHAFESTLPFGGVGNSGQGHYRGAFGFRELSHARAVVTFPAPFDSVAAVQA